MGSNRPRWLRFILVILVILELLALAGVLAAVGVAGASLTYALLPIFPALSDAAPGYFGLDPLADLKIIVTGVTVILALLEGLSMAQVHDWIHLVPIRTGLLARFHRRVGGITLGLVLLVFALCMYSLFGRNQGLVTLHAQAHVAFGTLAILALVAKVAIYNGAKKYVNLTPLLGGVAGVSLLGIFLTNALPYLLGV